MPTCAPPDGSYQAEIHLAREHQTILLPNRILLDTTPPEIKNAVANRQAFSPDGDRQADFVSFAYELSKPAHVQLYLDGTRLLNSHGHAAKGTVSWNGQVDGATLPPATYEIELGARDLAGNSTRWGSAGASASRSGTSRWRRIGSSSPQGAHSRSVSRRMRSGTRGSSAGERASRTLRCCACARRSGPGGTRSPSASAGMCRVRP